MVAAHSGRGAVEEKGNLTTVRSLMQTKAVALPLSQLNPRLLPVGQVCLQGLHTKLPSFFKQAIIIS